MKPKFQVVPRTAKALLSIRPAQNWIRNMSSSSIGYQLAWREEVRKWLEKNPDECVRYAIEDPKKSKSYGDYSGNPFVPSFASAAYRAEVRKLVMSLGEYSRSQPWGRRVIGMHDAYGGSCDGMPFGCLMVFSARGGNTSYEISVLTNQMSQAAQVEVKLERPYAVVRDSMTGETVAENAKSFTLRSDVTRLWMLETIDR